MITFESTSTVGEARLRRVLVPMDGLHKESMHTVSANKAAGLFIYWRGHSLRGSGVTDG